MSTVQGLIPYSTQSIDDSDLAAVREVLTSGWLTQGPAVPRFEQAFSARHATGHAVAVCNATAALHIGCLALGAGPGTLVWTSPISFVASANCALYCGAEIGFVDIDPVTRNLSVEDLAWRLEAARRDGRLPAIVIPVDFSGLPCDRAELRRLANQYGFRLLIDSSHAVGASYQGHPVGHDYADASVFSFHPVKIITTGEGGMFTTNDPLLAERTRLLRSHGITREPDRMVHAPDGPWYYEQVGLGFNYRMTDIQAALGTSQLRRLDAMQSRRDALARRYDERLAGLPLRLPVRQDDRTSSHHLYVIEIEGDDPSARRLQAFNQLRSRGVAANVHYIPIHLQPHYAQLGFRAGDFPHAEAYYCRALSLPLYPALSESQQDVVVDTLAQALQ